jgi:hypothetical protein
MAFKPSRRFLALPAFVWLFVPPLLVLLAYRLGRPGELSEPSERTDLLRPLILVTPDGDSFRFVPWEEQQNVSPLWAVDCTTTTNSTITWSLGFGEKIAWGFWKRSGSWRYALAANRFDQARKSDDPWFLPADDVKKLRSLIVEELNRRTPGENRGERLTQLLDQPIEHSSYICLQNAVILFAWLSIPIALASIVAMFIDPRSPVADKRL